MDTTAYVPLVQLNDGRSMPNIGLGTWQAEEGVRGERRVLASMMMVAAVEAAIDAGYRMIDTAYFYGNEEDVGTAVRNKIEAGVVTREQMFITTKLWVDSHQLKDVVPTCRKSLDNLGLDYIDLYLVHWPFGLKISKYALPQPFDAFDNATLEETWQGMEECVRLGLAKSIGVSNFNSLQVQRILNHGTVKPVVNQIECHPFLNQKKLIVYCRQRDVEVMAYSPLASPQSPTLTPGMLHPLLQDSRLQQIADTYGKTPAQIVLRYLIQLGTVPIPKSTNATRIKANIQVFDFTLSEPDMECLDSFNSDTRIFPFSTAKEHKDYPFNIPF